MDDTRRFYDDLAADYHLVYGDWWTSAERQGRALAGVVESRLGPGPKRVLDCTAGIGTQALGLSVLGHRVLGTDVSGRAVERARATAAERGLDARFGVHDVRQIDRLPGDPFDVVLSADNSLPHLLDPADLAAAARGMLARTSTAGIVIVGIRDYDAVLETRPTVEGPRVLGDPGRRRVVLQLWDWVPDEPLYDLSHLVLEEEDGAWRTTVRSCRCRALSRMELEGAFRDAGAHDLEWLEPAESGFFQPLLVVGRDASGGTGP